MTGITTERNDYRDGQVLSAAALRGESDYFLLRDRQHAALAHRPGILVGLELKPGSAADGSEPSVSSGAAIDALGRFILVPRSEPLAKSFAATLPSGTYRVELLYAEQGPATSGSDPCAGASATTVRERFRLQLVPSDEPLVVPAMTDVLDGASNNTALDAPLSLGTIAWDGASYGVVTETGRVYAGLVGRSVADPAGEAQLDLWDEGVGGGAVYRTADATTGAMTERAAIDPEGAGWFGRTSVGPEGMELRLERASKGRSPWSVRLDDTGRATPAAFGQDDKGDPSGGEYFPGQAELRIQFERDGSQKGFRRVVIGHVAPGQDDFQPALAVYDKPAAMGAQEGSATVEVWGDLFVRGTAWLSRVTRRPPDDSDPEDELDLILRQLMGPLGVVVRSWLLGDEEWVTAIAGAVAAHMQGDSLNQLAAAVAARMQSDAQFTAQITNNVQTALGADSAWINQVASAAVAQLDIDAVANALNLQPVYRLFHGGTSDHFYTQSATERDSAVASGYMFEGVAFKARAP